MAKKAKTTVLRDPGLKPYRDSTKSRKAARKRAAKENRILNKEAKHGRTVPGTTLPAYGWGTTEGEVPGWKSPGKVAPAKVTATEVATDLKLEIDGQMHTFPVSEANRKSVAARGEDGRPLPIQRSYVVRAEFCIDTFCGAQLMPSGLCPMGHSQIRPKRKP